MGEDFSLCELQAEICPDHNFNFFFKQYPAYNTLRNGVWIFLVTSDIYSLNVPKIREGLFTGWNWILFKKTLC